MDSEGVFLRLHHRYRRGNIASTAFCEIALFFLSGTLPISKLLRHFHGEQLRTLFSESDTLFGSSLTFFKGQMIMKKLYRIEVSTLWLHPEMNLMKWRALVYNFKTGELDVNQRIWPDGQNFFDPKHSPEIYAEKEEADAIYDELDFVEESWPPLSDIIVEGGWERLISYHLIAVDPDGSETVEAERDLPELYSMLNA